MTKVIDFNAKKAESIEKRKRAFERVLFKEFLLSTAEIDDHGSKYDIQIINISKTGLLFHALYSPQGKRLFAENKNLLLRLYFTKDDYLSVSLNIKHAQEYIDERGVAYWRIGGEFDQSLPSFQALAPFIEFIYKFAEFSCVDKGESKIYFL